MSRELTPREVEILHHLALSGMETKTVARELGIAFKTVETHRANIKWKLYLKNSADLTRYVYALHYAFQSERPKILQPASQPEGAPVAY